MARQSRRGHVEICRGCGRIFVARIWNQQDCSPACHKAWINRMRRRERAERQAREAKRSRAWAEDINAALLAGSLDPLP